MTNTKRQYRNPYENNKLDKYFESHLGHHVLVSDLKNQVRASVH